MIFVSVFFYASFASLPPCRVCGDGLGGVRKGITRVSTLPEGTVNSRRFSLSVFIVPLGSSARFSVPEVR